MKRLALILTFASIPALGQIVITPNVPSSSNITNDGFPVFSGSARQIAADIGNGIVSSCTINGGGTGGTYAVNDVLTIQQAGSNDNATCKVTAVSGGVITALQSSPVAGGTGYHASDQNYFGEPTTDGGGTGAIVKVTTTQCVAGTYACTVNWSVSATTGGATATFTSPAGANVTSVSGALPSIQVNFGGTGTTVTQSPAAGSAGPYTLTAGSTVTIQAQSTDDTSKTATFTFYLLPNGPSSQANGDNSLRILPRYQQVYEGEPAFLDTRTVGC